MVNVMHYAQFLEAYRFPQLINTKISGLMAGPESNRGGTVVILVQNRIETYRLERMGYRISTEYGFSNL